MSDLRPRLDEWVRRRIITRAQANQILAHEATSAEAPVDPEPAAAEAPPAPPVPPPPPASPRRTAGSVATEIGGYLASILVLVAAAMIVGQAETGTGRAALTGLVSAGLLGAGAYVRRERDESAARLSSWLWFLSVVGVGITLGLLAGETAAEDAPGTAVAISLGVTAYAALLYALMRRTLTQAALLGGVIATAISLVSLDDSAPAVAYGAALLAIGALWVVAGSAGALRPEASAGVLGGLAALVGAEVVFVPEPAWGFFLGIAVAAGLAAVSAQADRAPVMIVAAIGVVVFVVEGMIRAFGDSVGAPVVFLVVGAAMLVAVLRVGRLLERARRET